VPHGTDLMQIVRSSLEDDKAIDPVTLDLHGKTTIADFMVIATGSSGRHLAAMAEKLVQRLKQAGLVRLGVEGGETADWLLIDAGDVVVHLFREEVRGFYNLEKLWGVATPAQPAAQAIVARA
jgi:ribosome-associated protein